MYSDLAQEHIANPRNPGPLSGASHKGIAGTPGEGPYMILWFLVQGGAIERAAFQTYGSAAAVAAGSITTVLLTGPCGLRQDRRAGPTANRGRHRPGARRPPGG